MRRLVWLFLLIVGLAALLPASALAAAKDIPGTPMTLNSTVSGTVDATTKPRDVYAIPLTRGQEVQLTLTLSQYDGMTGSDCLLLVSPSSKSIVNNDYEEVADAGVSESLVETITYTPAVDGTYYIDVHAGGMNGLGYSLTAAPTATPAITGPYAADIFGIAVGPGVVQGVVDAVTYPRNVFAVRLFAGEPVQLTLNDPAGQASVFLFPPSTRTVTVQGAYVASGDTGELVTYTPATNGIYFIDVRAYECGVTYSLTVGGSAEKPLYPTHLYLHASKRSMRRGAKVNLSGSLVDQNLAPLADKSLVLLSSTDGKTWKRCVALHAKGARFACSRRLKRTTHFRVYFKSDGTYAGSLSRPVVVKVKAPVH